VTLNDRPMITGIFGDTTDENCWIETIF